MMSASDLERAKWLLGPWLLGGFFDVFFQGILYCQFVRYATRYPNDRLAIKISVFILFVLTTLKTIHTFILVWIQFIDYFTDLDAAINLSYVAWWQEGFSLITATMDLYVQVFFVRRLFYVSGRKWWVVTPIAVILAFSYAAICLATFYISVGASATPLMIPWFAAHFGSLVGGDILMTSAMTFFLIKTRKEVLPQTVGLLTALIRITWLSALPATVCAMLNLIFDQVWQGTNRLLSTAFGMMLPKLYAMSMMWTINARLSIRKVGAKHTTGQLMVSDSKNLALRQMSTPGQGIQVQMSTETNSQTDPDVYEMFHSRETASTLVTSTSKPSYFASEKV